MEEIRVRVVEFGDRQHYQMQWRDPITGRKKTKTTKIERTGRAKEQKEAEKAAAQLEADLQADRHHEPSKLTWTEFRERYENEVLASLAPGTDTKVFYLFNRLERILSPQRLRDVTAERLSFFQAELRGSGLAESTIKTYLNHLKAALHWAARMKMITTPPAVQMPKRAKGGKIMKGRPITLEEFERMLDKVQAVLTTPTPSGKATTPPRQQSKKPRAPAAAERFRAKADERARELAIEATPSWRHLLEGLWASGLRLGEALDLWWDRDDRLCVDLSGKRPMLRIPAAHEKGNQDRLLPMAPEFAEFLLRTPEAERTGRVFRPKARRVKGEQLQMQHTSKVICDIGKAAGVKVNTDAAGKVKYASAHDFRRSFGERWAMRVMPQVLKELMRHETIETTMRYYVGRNAQATAEALWEAQAVSSRTDANSRTDTAAHSSRTDRSPVRAGNE